jgi:hypothetical protein
LIFCALRDLDVLKERPLRKGPNIRVLKVRINFCA